MEEFDRIVIPEPDPNRRTILLTAEGHTLKCGGSRKYFCGRCGEVLVDGVDDNQIRNTVLKCWKCGSFNSVDVLISRSAGAIQDIGGRSAGDPTENRFGVRERKIRCTKCAHANIVLLMKSRQTDVSFNGYDLCNVAMEPINSNKFTWIVKCSKCGNEDVCIVPMPFKQKR
jgi:DNA-directed RNA polymerase subunit M/transcription elongation factor TFIIS